MRMSWNQFNSQFRESYDERQERLRRSMRRHQAEKALADLTNEAASAAHAAQVDREGSRDELQEETP